MGERGGRRGPRQRGNEQEAGTNQGAKQQGPGLPASSQQQAVSSVCVGQHSMLPHLSVGVHIACHQVSPAVAGDQGLRLCLVTRVPQRVPPPGVLVCELRASAGR